MKLEKVDIYDVKLYVNGESNDFSWYKQRGVFEERASLLYSFLKNERFNVFVDVGANYGYISILAQKNNPNLKIYSFEADPCLISIIQENFKINGIENFEIINAIIAAEDDNNTTFSLNPNGTLDNRVSMANWTKVNVPSMKLDNVLANKIFENDRFFIKIDTQGYEQFVLSGAERTLQKSDNWLIKMEFAPNWLRSQGSDPLDLLHYLTERYNVAEFPARIPYGTKSLNEMAVHHVNDSDLGKFLTYIESLNLRNLGWIDLLISPKHHVNQRM